MEFMLDFINKEQLEKELRLLLYAFAPVALQLVASRKSELLPAAYLRFSDY
jgi:hypothetical protein